MAMINLLMNLTASIVTTTINWSNLLSEHLYNAINNICPELINSNNHLLATIIYQFVFVKEERENKKLNELKELIVQEIKVLDKRVKEANTLKALLTYLIKKEIPTISKQSLELTYLSLFGASIIVQQNNYVCPKELNDHMESRYKKISSMIEERKQEMEEGLEEIKEMNRAIAAEERKATAELKDKNIQSDIQWNTN